MNEETVVIIPASEPDPPQESAPAIERDLGYALAMLETLQAKSVEAVASYTQLRDELAAHRAATSADLESLRNVTNAAAESAASAIDAIQEEAEEVEETEEAEEAEEAASVEEATAAEAAIAAAAVTSAEVEPIRKKRGFISLLHSE